MKKSSSTKPPLITLIYSNKKALIILVLVIIGLVVTYMVTFSSQLSYNTRATINPSFSNTMMEQDMLDVNIDQQTRKFTIDGAFCFGRNLRTGSECYGLWISTDPEGLKSLASYPPPPSRAYSPFEKQPYCQAKLDAFPGYPAVCERTVPPPPAPGLQHWLTNWGILGRSTHESHASRYQPHTFHFEGTLPEGFPSYPDNCILYIHYSSNRQSDRPFFALDVCGPTPTPTPTPTPFMSCPDIRGPFVSKYACEELCLLTGPSGGSDTTAGGSGGSAIPGGSGGSSGGTGSIGGSVGGTTPLYKNCQPGPNNSSSAQLGEWYCCPGVNCGALCTDEAGDGPRSCNPPLKCIRGGQLEVQLCQDALDCEESHSCWCKSQLSPTLTLDQPKGCFFYGEERCHDYCQTCYADGGCTQVSETGAYCKY